MRLSICIPTYNFGAFIGETLQSILPQLAEDVEVVILDGGSTDDTTEVVHSFQERYPSLRYVRQDARGGIDRDLARNVELASGEYCWLFCSDDIMRPGAVQAMLREIESAHDLYVCGFTLCTPAMEPFKEEPIMRLDSDAEFELADAEDRERYFASAQTTPAFFSFAGSLILKKTRWDSVPLNEEFVGSCWAHVARLFELAPQGLRVKYLASSHLDKRTENDSFMDHGLVRRYALAIDGYNRLGDTFFGRDSVEAQHIRRVVRNEFPPWILLEAKSQNEPDGPKNDLALLDRLAATTYSDRSLRNRLYLAVYRHTPVWAYRAVLRLYRRLKPLAIWHSPRNVT